MVTFKELELIKQILAMGGAPASGGAGEDVLRFAREHLRYEVFRSEDELRGTYESLLGRGLVDGAGVTAAGMAEIEPCRVDNAVILAAGGVARSSKSIYSLPKGLYVRDGETLIERQIRQLREAGIRDITVVVGYRQELYFYLGEKCGVRLVCSTSPGAGNVVSLNDVADRLGRTYICNCDNFFAQNPFSAYEYDSFHATVWKEDALREVKVRTNRSGRIVGIYTDRDAGECLYGHAFVDQRFSSRLREYMAGELDVFRVDRMFWEELALGRHIQDMDMYARRYSTDFLMEFDTVAETQSTETLFINDVSDRMKRKICKVLGCETSDIGGIEVLDVGMTNVNLTFLVRGRKYMFRYPGESSWDLASRKQECVAQRVAMDLGLDSSCIYIDEEGCKIALYREGVRDLSKEWVGNEFYMKKTAEQMRKLHDATRGVPMEGMDFDPVAEGDRLMGLAGARKGDLSVCFGKLREDVGRVWRYMQMDGWPKVLSHHDWKYDNVLVTDTTYDVIDWEYGTLDDPGSDLLRLLMYYDKDDPMVGRIIDWYFGREATGQERVHLIAAWAPNSWYWMGWLMYQESLGEECGFWTLLYWQKAHEACEIALPYYEGIYGELEG